MKRWDTHILARFGSVQINVVVMQVEFVIYRDSEQSAGMSVIYRADGHIMENSLNSSA